MRIGLSLSGGGFRATLFHIGVIRHLRDIGALQQVTHICSVSGGSILAAYLVRHWQDFCGDDARFDARVQELIDHTSSDLRGRFTRHALLNLSLAWWPGRRRTRTDLFMDHLDDLFGGDNLDAWQDQRPRLHILATNLTNGRLCSFSQLGYHVHESGQLRDLPTDGIRAAFAVTASAAFPAFFPPLRITSQEIGVDAEAFGLAEQWLTDGGVFDNLGARSLRALQASGAIDRAIVSDAGGVCEVEPLARFGSILNSSSRAVDVMLERIADFEYQSLGFREAERSGRYLPNDANSDLTVIRIAELVERDRIPTALPQKVQRQLVHIRTDFDRFSRLEIAALIAHATNVSRKMLPQASVENKNDEDASLPQTQDASPSTALWLPQTHKLPDEKTLLEDFRLSRASRLKSHAFAWRDWRSWLTVCLLLLYIAIPVAIVGGIDRSLREPGIDIQDVFPHRYTFSIEYVDYADRWIAALQDQQQRDAVMTYVETGIVDPDLADLIATYERQVAAEGKVGTGIAYLTVRSKRLPDGKPDPKRQDWRGVVSYHFPNSSRVFLELSATCEGSEVTGELIQHPRSVDKDSYRIPIELSRSGTSYVGTFIHPGGDGRIRADQRLKLGMLRMDASDE